jgi:RHS repeat-associated protein
VGSGSVLNEVVLEYNALGLLDREYQSASGAKGVGTPYVEYDYDETASSGELTKGYRLKSIRYPNERLVHYQYGSGDNESLNRLDAITDFASGSGTVFAKYKYLGRSRVVEIDYQEADVRLDLIGTGTSYTGLDRFGRVIDQKWYDYGSSADVDRYKYGYDRVSNRTYRENTITSNKDEFYTYDGIHRVKNFDRGNLNGTYNGMTGTVVKEQDWTLDPLGNWTSLLEKNSGSTSLTHFRSHTKANEVTTFNTISGTDWEDVATDRAGNLTTVPKPSALADGYTLTWDAWNRLYHVVDAVTSQTVAYYAYDGLHRRTKQLSYSGGTLSETRYPFYSQSWQVLEERVDTSSNAESQFVWGPRYIDELVLRDRDTNDNGTMDERRYYLQDANWNVTCLVDSSGNAQERYEYLPYGQVQVMNASWGNIAVSAVANPYTYTGRRLDPETGLNQYRNRYYHAQLGRFVSRDPIGYRGRSPNLYQYVGSMPAVSTDPTGEVPFLIVAGGIAAGWFFFGSEQVAFAPTPGLTQEMMDAIEQQNDSENFHTTVSLLTLPVGGYAAGAVRTCRAIAH